jgi:hypothetical protein
MVPKPTANMRLFEGKQAGSIPQSPAIASACWSPASQLMAKKKDLKKLALSLSMFERHIVWYHCRTLEY